MSKANKFSDLPRMYSIVWCSIEWVRDYCVNGEHDQQVGHYLIQVRRARNDDNSWSWVPVKSKLTNEFHWLDDFEKREVEEWLFDCSTDLGEGLNWSHKISELPNPWRC